MDSPSLDSPPPILSDREGEAGDIGPTGARSGRATRNEVVLIASFGDAVAADFAAFVSQSSRGDAIVVGDESIRRLVVAPIRSLSLDECLRPTREVWSEQGQAASLILFIASRLTERDRRGLDDLLEVASRWPIQFIGIVSTFRVHLDDPEAAGVEDHVRLRASTLPARVVVFRPGHVLSRNSRISRFLQRFASLYPLMPKRLRSCFLEGPEFFAAIERERLAEGRRAGPEDPWPGADPTASPSPAGRAVSRRNREYTLLGSNLSWRDMLSRRRATGPGRSLATAASLLLSWLFVGQLIALAVTLMARGFPGMRQWHVHTLTPRSMRELLSLCHRRNIDHVKVVGYNNGVDHFGHRYPGKTIVSTVRCRRMAQAGPHTLKADCGATVRDALDFLARSDREPYVIPNYSYVCLGTSFFVPIHGSAVDYSTVAATICRVVLYDPERDRVISAARDDLDFVENLYNLQSRVVVLRVYLLTKPKSSYFVHRQAWKNPTASDLLDTLRDRDATNVEIRQSHAASATVTVSKYYKELGETSSSALQLPRDALGRLWDRLEENPLTSYLMHAVGRHVVWHAELFFTPREFALFWQTHGQLPLRKIQLRYIRRDGLAHSPFRDEDCVSADLFMFRRHRFRFQDYLKNTFPAVRTNPGKHSK